MNRKKRTRIYLTATVVVCSFALLSCSDCNFERKRVEAFLANDANFTCETDDDCETAMVDCLEIEGEFCGQIATSKRANASQEWQELRGDLAECMDVDVCTTCNAALLATCNNGSCR